MMCEFAKSMTIKRCQAGISVGDNNYTCEVYFTDIKEFSVFNCQDTFHGMCWIGVFMTHDEIDGTFKLSDRECCNCDGKRYTNLCDTMVVDFDDFQFPDEFLARFREHYGV